MSLRKPALAAFAFTLFALVAAGAHAACEDVVVRAWYTDGKDNTFHEQGETIVLDNGEEVHLYLHHKSEGRLPYGASGEMGLAERFRIRGHNARGVLDVRPQSADDLEDGRLIIETKAPGKATLGYRMTGVKQAGVFEQLDAACRTGRIELEVRAKNAGTPPPTPVPPPADGELTPGKAARQLLQQLRRGLLFWERAELAEAELAAIESRGVAALAEIAGNILASDDYREESWDAILDQHPDLQATQERVAEQLITDLHQQLYGDLGVDRIVYQRHVDRLVACLGERRANACRELGRDLVEYRGYARNNRERLAILP